MKTYKRLLLLFCCTVVLFSNLFMCYKTPVFAKPTLDEDGHLHVYNWDDIKDCAVDWVMYMASMAGAIFADYDFAKYVQNKEAWVNYWKEDNVIIGEDGASVTFSQELMAFIKQCIDEYAKTEQTKEENGGFYLLPTTKFDNVPVNQFANSQAYSTFRNIVIEKGVLSVRTNYNGTLYFSDPFSDPDHPIALIGKLSSLNDYFSDPELKVSCNYYCLNDWKYEAYGIMKFPTRDQIYTSCSEAELTNTGSSGYYSGTGINSKEGDFYNFVLYSTTGERLRVFVSEVAAKNYSLGSRKIYFTENYYNYEPEDLTVAVDDLQKSVDDLQKVIDELLKQICDDTSEKEIEELLRLILEELRKNPGGGGGSGGGDVTVSVDLKETNNWLSKIYDKVCEINERMTLFFESLEQTILEGIQTKLDEIAETLKKIKGWTIADTIIDGIDAVADWAQFIRDFLDDTTSGVATVASTMTDATELMKTKFPFCLPWDMYMLITFLAHEPQTPVFELPIIIEGFGIEEYIVVDMTRFSGLSTLSRTLLSIIYCYGLINFTFKVLPMVKEEN